MTALAAVDAARFDAEVLNSDVPVLVDFWAAWCGPCKQVMPVLEQIAEQTPQMKVVKVNIDENPALAQACGVMSVPTLALFSGGRQVKVLTGPMPRRAIENALAPHLS